MISFTGQQTLYQQLTSDLDEANLLMGVNFLRQGQRALQAILRIYNTDELRTFSTVASQTSYNLPENFKSLTTLYVTVDSTQYEARLIQDEELWRELQANTQISVSDYVQFCYIRPTTIEIYPIPSSSQTATIIYRAAAKDLVAEDYSFGTITTLANGSTAVTGSLSVWTSKMAGRYFRIDDDGEWYKIASVESNTALTLELPYQGVSIATGTDTYLIGQMPITPADTHDLPVYYAAWKYFIMKKNVQMAREMERMWKEGVKNAETSWANRSSSNVTKGYPYAKNKRMVNPNNFPEGMT